MQAIMETLFDAVYLVSVITIGILMIQKCQGEKQYRLFGIWRRFPSHSQSLRTLYHRTGALCNCLRHGKIYYFHYYDHLLYSSVLCMENPLSY